MKYKPLNIGELTARIPLVQGGMGVGISLSGLAAAVANVGGVGLISTAQIGFREPTWDSNPLESNLKALAEELKKARALSPKGILGFNIMVATKRYEEYVGGSKGWSRDYRIGSRTAGRSPKVCGRL